MSTINKIAISIIMMATVLVYSARLVTCCLFGLWYGLTDMINWVLCHEHCFVNKVHYIIELHSVPGWSSWLRFLIEVHDWSSCNSSSTLTPSRMLSRPYDRGRFNNFVELSTLTPSRTTCRAPRRGQRIARSLIFSRQHTPNDSTVTKYPISVTMNLSRAAFVIILSISVTITNR